MTYFGHGISSGMTCCDKESSVDMTYQAMCFVQSYNIVTKTQRSLVNGCVLQLLSVLKMIVTILHLQVLETEFCIHISHLNFMYSSVDSFSIKCSKSATTKKPLNLQIFFIL